MNKDINILVVDDFATIRNVVKGLLKELDFNSDKVDQADDGDVAWEMLQKKNYHLLITDWHMPRMTGIELLRKVRADDRLAKLPVLVLTAEAKKEQIIEAAKAGASEYLLKPFNVDSLGKKLKKII